MRLVLPEQAFRLSYLSYIEELGDEERYPFPLNFDHTDFSAMLRRNNEFRQGIKLPSGYVPSTTLWWISDTNTLVGVVNIRHYLNPTIFHCGGHIGLSIRPSLRHQGLGTALLKQALDYGKSLGIDEFHIHCHSHNSASVNMIIRNGGVLHSTIVTSEHSESISRFIVSA